MRRQLTNREKLRRASYKYLDNKLDSSPGKGDESVYCVEKHLQIIRVQTFARNTKAGKEQFSFSGVKLLVIHL